MGKRLTRGQAIKKYCKEECCANSIPDWKECSHQECSLWTFRLGRELEPKRKSPVRKIAVNYVKVRENRVPSIELENYDRILEEGGNGTRAN